MQAQTEMKRPAFRYYGGKFLLAPWIISHFPPHRDYVEPCGGAASVLLQKPRSALETYNDINGHVVNFFKVLRNQSDMLIQKIRLTPWSRAEFEECRFPDDEPIEDARRFYVSSWMAISGKPFDAASGFRTSSFADQQRSRINMQFSDESISYLYDIIHRFDGVQIENQDALDVIRRYDNDRALIYFDPPYVKSTRATANVYDFEVDEDFHIKAAELLRQCQGFVVVSGYPCELYGDIYEAIGWERIDKESQVNGGNKRVESLWLSPRTVDALKYPKQVSLFESIMN